jgi:uncharacterized protein (DUF2342 family)
MGHGEPLLTRVLLDQVEQVRCFKFQGLTTALTTQDQTLMVMMGVTTGHIGILGRQAMDQPGLEQELQGTVNSRRGTRSSCLTQHIQQLIGTHGAGLANNQFQHLSAQRGEIDGSLMTELIGSQKLLGDQFITQRFDADC